MIETREIKLGDFAFTVDVSGSSSAPSVLLLHGFPESRHMWRTQLEPLAKAGFCAIAPDQRGYSRGARPPSESAYATDHLVSDALRLMDALGHKRFHLIGHDWGGQLAWLIAASKPDRLITLTILSRPHPAAFVKAMAEDPDQPKRSGHHRAFREADVFRRMRDANLKPLRDALTKQGVPEADAEKHLAILSEPGAMEAAINWYRASTIATPVPPITVPTLYVWGKNDATVGRLAAELTVNYVTGPYRFVEVNAGHFLVEERPEEVTKIILDHLRSKTT
jgi:pimeloyl-ACP methyl ester carboxylesterase